LLFKISAAPFHLWVPDVYQGTAYPILAALSVVPKLAAFAFLTHWTAMIEESTFIIGILAIFTLIAGNFGALQQNNVRRLMGFSSIAHSGFMLLALIQVPGYLMFYAGIYVLMTVGIFHLLNHYHFNYGLDTVEDYRGMRRLSRLKTLYVVIWMIALTGLPPTAGFTAKLLLFTGLGEMYVVNSDPFLMVLIIVGILNAVISLAYYLKIPYQMIFKPSDQTIKTLENNVSFSNLFGTILVLLVLLLFIKPGWLMSWLNNANFVL
jgi:NADH-quinone oxidoreductase subunit N